MNDRPVETCAFGTAQPPVETQKRREASCWRLLNILDSLLLPDWREETFVSANDVEGLFACVARQDSSTGLPSPVSSGIRRLGSRRPLLRKSALSAQLSKTGTRTPLLMRERSFSSFPLAAVSMPF